VGPGVTSLRAYLENSGKQRQEESLPQTSFIVGRESSRGLPQ